MQFIKINERYVNMAQVHEIEVDTTPGINTIYLYTSDHTIRVVDPTEQRALLAWLGRNSVNILTRAEA